MNSLTFLFFISVLFTFALAAQLPNKVATSVKTIQGNRPRHPSRPRPYVIYPRRKYRALIYFAASDFATLYVNGVKRSVAKNKFTKRIYLYLRRGDVIGVVSTSTKRLGGVLVDMRINGRHYYTGQPSWRATLGRSRFGRAWMIRKTGYCWAKPRHWSRRGSKWARGFPYKYGARAIWPRSSRNRFYRMAFFRFVVGGNRCGGGRPPVPRPPTHPKHCRCRLAKAQKSVCYELKKPDKPFGRCKPRSCERSYECVSRQTQKLPLCMRRYTTEKVVHVKGKYCKKVSMKQAFYIPYEA